VVGSIADRSVVDRCHGARDRCGDAILQRCASPTSSRYPAQAFVDVNVGGTLDLLEAADALPGTTAS